MFKLLQYLVGFFLIAYGFFMIIRFQWEKPLSKKLWVRAIYALPIALAAIEMAFRQFAIAHGYKVRSWSDLWVLLSAYRAGWRDDVLAVLSFGLLLVTLACIAWGAAREIISRKAKTL